MKMSTLFCSIPSPLSPPARAPFAVLYPQLPSLPSVSPVFSRKSIIRRRLAAALRLPHKVWNKLKYFHKKLCLESDATSTKRLGRNFLERNNFKISSTNKPPPSLRAPHINSHWATWLSQPAFVRRHSITMKSWGNSWVCILRIRGLGAICRARTTGTAAISTQKLLILKHKSPTRTRIIVLQNIWAKLPRHRNLEFYGAMVLPLFYSINIMTITIMIFKMTL